MRWRRTLDNHGIVGGLAQARTANGTFATHKIKAALRLCRDSGYRNQEIAAPYRGTRRRWSARLRPGAELRAQLMLAAGRLNPRLFRASRAIYSTRGAENRSGARNCCIACTSSSAGGAARVPMASAAPPSPARKASRLARTNTSAYSWCPPNQFLLMQERKLSLALNSITCRLVVEISIFLQISSDDRPITSRIENTSASRLDMRWQHS